MFTPINILLLKKAITFCVVIKYLLIIIFLGNLKKNILIYNDISTSLQINKIFNKL